MSLSLRGRLAVLAAIAVAALVVAALVTRGSGRGSGVPQPAGGSFTALAAAYVPTGRRTACGVRIRPRLVGVAHPVLPCGVKLYLDYRGREVLTQVIDRGQIVPGREFALTRQLARLLRLHGTQKITWRFAR
ncbi:MAG: hypothetical protein ACYDCH_00295 [Gaiellaceae bacterium]